MSNVNANEKNKKININKEGLRIVKVAAFCFAIVSFIATAQGLATYVFEYSWQAYLISFGIQSILFVFNLKLPYYFKKIGDAVPDDEKKKRKHHASYKWTFMQKVIAIFYVAVIISSSWFSYVFIVNVAYANTQYIDANIVLDSKFREYLDTTEDYVNESIKINQLLTTNILSELQSKIDEDDNSLSKSKLQSLILEAQNNLDDKEVELEAAIEKQTVAKTIYEEPMTSRWRSESEHEREREEYNKATDAVTSARKAVNNAKAEIERLNNTNLSATSIAKSFLQEMLNPNPSLDDYQKDGATFPGLTTYINTLNEYIIQSGDSNITSENYSDIVIKTEEINICVKNYILLRQILDREGEENDISDFNDLVKTNIIDIPEIGTEKFNDQLAKWDIEWKQRFLKLERVIKSVPEYSDVVNTYRDSYNTIIDFNVLSSYNKQNITDSIDKLVRSNLASINQLERAFNLLSCEYPFLAWFSLVLACFLDMASLLAGLFIYYVTKKNKNVE